MPTACELATRCFRDSLDVVINSLVWATHRTKRHSADALFVELCPSPEFIHQVGHKYDILHQCGEPQSLGQVEHSAEMACMSGFCLRDLVPTLINITKPGLGNLPPDTYNDNCHLRIFRGKMPQYAPISNSYETEWRTTCVLLFLSTFRRIGTMSMHVRTKYIYIYI